MSIDYEITQSYITELSRHEDPVLLRMEKEAERDRFPIIGPAAGRFCHLMARAIEARKVFELGSGYGYSTFWFAKAVRENGGGEVHHTVWNKGLHERAKMNLGEAGFGSLVYYHLSEAVQALKCTPGPFDIIFNDIDKELYPASFPVMKEKLRVGGLILIDNMLVAGRAYDSTHQDPGVQGIRELTRLINEDPDFLSQLVPIRDGIVCALKVR